MEGREEGGLNIAGSKGVGWVVGGSGGGSGGGSTYNYFVESNNDDAD